ncbi:hypothetical protein Btru_051896 [Bulinus truncatus]|nr:hypothetical protein Btru_051896 [Bulinus truncatus]
MSCLGAPLSVTACHSASLAVTTCLGAALTVTACLGAPFDGLSRCPIESDGLSRCLIDREGLSRCLIDSDGLSRCPIDSDVLSRCLIDSDDLSRCLIDSDGLSRCPIDSDVLSRCPIDSDVLSRCLIDSDGLSMYLLFGSCQDVLNPSVHRHSKFHLERQQIERLEKEIRYLIQAGFTWKDAYTQCTIQNILMHFHHGRAFDHHVCQDALGVGSPDWSSEVNDDIANVLVQLLESGKVDIDALVDVDQAGRDMDRLNSHKRDEIVQVHKYFDKSTGQLKRDPFFLGRDALDGNDDLPNPFDDADDKLGGDYVNQELETVDRPDLLDIDTSSRLTSLWEENREQMDNVIGGLCHWWTVSLVDNIGGQCQWCTVSLVDCVIGVIWCHWWTMSLVDCVIGGLCISGQCGDHHWWTMSMVYCVDCIIGGQCQWCTVSLVDCVIGGLCHWWTVSLVDNVIGGLLNV